MERRHPQHAAITATLRAWYTTSAPAMGYEVQRRRFGCYMHHRTGFGEVTVMDTRPEDVPALLAEVQAYYDATAVGIYLDDQRADALLGPALVAAGCARAAAETHLVHVGGVPVAHPVSGVVREPMREATITEWATTKLQGFANSEVAPDPERLAAEVAVRRAEFAGAGRFFFARASREPAALLGLYDGADRHIFLLATRVPFRHRGIARWLLARAIADAYADGCRSVLINCDPADTPIQLYRRLGFIDEVYWRQRYELPSPAT